MGILGNIFYENKVMLQGLSSNIDRLSRRGIDDKFINRFQALLDSCEKLSARQAMLKMDLRTTEDQLCQQLTELEKVRLEAAARVKKTFDKTAWKIFGLDAG